MSGLAFRGEGKFVNIKIKNPNYATFDRQETEQFENARMFKLYVTAMPLASSAVNYIVF